MKKGFIKFIIFIAFIGAIILVKTIIDNKTINYSDTVKSNLTDYFISGNEKYLDNIVNILEDNLNNERIRENIQSVSYSIIGNWFTYLDNKYLCDAYNLNSCIVQLDEFTTLNQKLNTIYEKKSSDGYTIIRPSYYSSLKRQGEKKVNDLQSIVENPNATNPLNSEDIRLNKCSKATECSCREYVCTCYYTEGSIREKITCKDNSYVPEKK